MSQPRSFRVVIFTSASPDAILRLVSRMQREVPEIVVSGVLHENRPPKTLLQRTKAFFKNLRDWSFIQYALERIVISIGRAIGEAAGRLLCFAHACKPYPGGKQSVHMLDLARYCESNGGKLFITADIHSSEALEFVRAAQPDLGIIYGTRILKPELFTIPRQGSINIHKRKVPDYRGGGPVGLWEMLDGQKEIGVTVHRVEVKLDAGAVVQAATIPIDDYDTLNSLALKADVVGNDLLIRAAADFARGTVHDVPQVGTGKMFKNPKPQQLALYEKELKRRRPGYQPVSHYPMWKLLLRTFVLAPYAISRNWYRRLTGSFPVTILFHHLVSDRRHPMAIPTDWFREHVKFLEKHYRVVTLAEGVRLLQSGKVNVPTVVLTFDDGYQTNFTSLRAIVEMSKVPVSMFVCTQRVATQQEFEHDSTQGLRDFLPLTIEQVKYLSDSGWEIGAHTRNHLDCGTKDLALLREEILGSKEDLEQCTGKPVEFFSFPFGRRQNMSPAAKELAKANFPYVFSAEGGANFPQQARDRFLVRAFHPSSLWQLELTCQSMLDFRVAGAPPFLGERRPARRLTANASMG
jgi:peptidoglycan/xylan/chitin deacetylase (PgdA/CDA1 family)/folate-dependent phosphoribosylglycinamide formyltransferase PurN